MESTLPQGRAGHGVPSSLQPAGQCAVFEGSRQCAVFKMLLAESLCPLAL